MAIENTQPNNTNFLSPLGFRFHLKRAPTTNYFCQSANLPSVSLSEIQNPNPFVNVPYPGTNLEYNPLTLRFRVDEDMKNYLEIYNWLIGLTFPEEFEQYRNESNASSGQLGEAKDVVTDATLTVLTANHVPNINIFYYDIFPTDLTPLEFDTTQQDIEYLESTATFQYRNFKVETIT